MKVEFCHDIHWSMYCNIWKLPSSQLAGRGGLFGLLLLKRIRVLRLVIDQPPCMCLIYIVSHYHFGKAFGTLASSLTAKRTGLNLNLNLNGGN